MQRTKKKAGSRTRRRFGTLRAIVSSLRGLCFCSTLVVLGLGISSGSGCSSEKARGSGAAGETIEGPRASPAELAARPAARRAFYYWRTVFQLSEAERRALAEHRIERIYLRMFDIAWQDERVELVGKVAPGDDATRAQLPLDERGAPLELVPVVFVRVEVLRQLSDEARAELAGELWREVKARAERLGFAPRELQLDCDWTDGTREAFFALTREVKRQSGLTLSATIRLHQVKYRERTGVPPVERGMLMFYNMGKITAEAGSRSIFDPEAASRYVSRVGEYPLPLDVALPIWSWTVHVRDGQVLDVLQSTDPAELEGVAFLKPLGGGRYAATQTAFFRGALLREGDELAGDVTGPAEARAAATMLAPHLARLGEGISPRVLALFDLSERNLSRHGRPSLEHLFATIR